METTQFANMTLWCKRGTETIPFTVSVGSPRLIETGLWECDWSLGNLLLHEGAAIKNINPFLALLTTIGFIGRYLKGRSEAGDLFYLDEALAEPIDAMGELFFGMLDDGKQSDKQNG